MSRFELTWVCWAVSCLLGCSVKSPVATQAAAPYPRTSASASAPVSKSWQRVFYPAVPTEARLVELGADHVQRALLGSFRVELEGADVRLAETAPLDPLTWSCRSGDGWLHSSSGGVVYASNDYLGDLTRVGVIQDHGASLLQCGPEVVLDGTPPVRWSRAGAQPLEAPKRLGFVHFRNDREGKALAFPDLPFVTHDGGKSFNLAKQPISVIAAAEAVPKPYTLLEEGAFAATLAPWLRRAVASEAGRALGGVRLSDGTWLRSATTSNRILVALREPSGQVTSLEVPGVPCELVPFGARLLAYCVHEGGLRSIYPERKSIWNGYPREHFLGDDAGQYLFALGDGETWPQSYSPLGRFDGKSWQTYRALQGQPLVARHGWLAREAQGLVATEHPEQPGPNLTPHGERVTSGLSLLEHSVMFTRSKESWDDVLVEIELPSGRELRQIKLDRTHVNDTRELAFADSEHGVAWGALEAGAHEALVWSPSEAKFVSMQGPDVLKQEENAQVRCDPDSCRLDSVQAFARAAPDPQVMLPDPPQRIGFLEWATTPPEPIPDHKTGFDLGDYACQLHASADVVAALTSGGGFLTRAQLEFVARLTKQSEDAESSLPFEAVPLANGRVLGRVLYSTHQVLLVLDKNAAVVVQRAIKLTGQQGDYLALNGKEPGLAVLDDDAPSFVSLAPQAAPQPLALPKARLALPCQGPTPPKNLQIFAFDEAPLAWDTEFSEDRTTPTSFGVLEVTPGSACLRGVVVNSLIAAKLTAQNGALRGTASGQHRAVPVLCNRTKSD